MEFVQGKERCLKFISQDLTFLQSSSIPSTFNNISNTDSTSANIRESHTQTALLSIQLPTCIPQEHGINPPTQTVEPVLGFTPADIQRAEAEPKRMLEQLLRLKSYKEYVQMPIQTLDGIHVHQPHWFLPLAKEAKKISRSTQKGTGCLPMGRYPTSKTTSRIICGATKLSSNPQETGTY